MLALQTLCGCNNYGFKTLDVNSEYHSITIIFLPAVPDLHQITMNIEWIEDRLDPEMYCALRVLCGWSPKSYLAAYTGLQCSLYIIGLGYKGSIIGMGKIIGDGGCFRQIVDICVLP